MSTARLALNKQRSAFLLRKSGYSKTSRVHLTLANNSIFYTPVLKVLNNHLQGFKEKK